LKKLIVADRRSAAINQIADLHLRCRKIDSCRSAIWTKLLRFIQFVSFRSDWYRSEVKVDD